MSIVWSFLFYLELTSACKRINKDTCYEFVTYHHTTSQKKSTKFNILRSKIYNYKQRSKSACRLSTRIRPKIECTSPSPPAPIDNNEQPLEHLAHATSTSPTNLSMIVKQSYKPLHAKSTQFNKNTIAVTKGILPLCSTWTILTIVWLRISVFFSYSIELPLFNCFRFIT
jgi:hypothetical protein